MSFADDDELTEFVAGGHLIPNVTEATVATAMNGFVLSLLPAKNMGWLAMAVDWVSSRRAENPSRYALDMVVIRHQA